MEGSKAAEYRRGLLIGIALAALTAFEFWAASMASGPVPYPVLCLPLAPITWLALSVARSPLMFLVVGLLVKAGLIVNYYMHLGKTLAEVD
jgi:hypothetical protein